MANRHSELWTHVLYPSPVRPATAAWAAKAVWLAKEMGEGVCGP